jgi:beta-phosphoglucomutase family hydrolase
MLKAVIFDMDGVIVDSEPAHLRVCLRLFKDMNIDISEEEYKKFIGVSNTSMWTTLKNDYKLGQTVEELAKRQATANIEDFKCGNEKPIPGIVDLLSYLKIEKIKIGLASSSPMEAIEMILERFGIRHYFDAVVSGEGLKRGKPAPDIFLKTAELLRVPSECCVVIEDSNHGVTAARSAGMRCIGFQNINSGKQDLSHSDIIVDSIEKLNITILKELFRECN